MENEALIADLVEWIAKQPRPYNEVMDAWRTSCPRLSIWEDTVDLGLVVRELGEAGAPVVKVTEAGQAFLRERQGL